MGVTHSIEIGSKEVWGRSEPVRLSCADRRRHVYVVGMSGTGKTTLLRSMILQDIEAGHGVAFIDPHGDAALELLDAIPRHRTEDVVYFDPSDDEFSVSFNLLARVPPERRHLVASGIVAAFKGIFPEFFGPRMEYVFYAAVAALLDCENVSLLGLQRMLTDAEYRNWVVGQVKDPVVRRFWEVEFESQDKRTKAEIVSPILNKIGPVLMSPQLRNILGQSRNRIGARFIMDTGRIFIANLSKGKLGADKASLLGSLLVSQFEVAAMSRADTPEADRRDFYLYADEFHSFVTDSFATLLAEARKYRLCLTLSHQYLRQLKPAISDAVFGNCGTLVSFCVGHDDAEALSRAFGNTYSAAAFTGLSRGETFARVASDGRNSDPFPCCAAATPIRRTGRLGILMKRCREKYSMRRETIEGKINAWFDRAG